MLTPSPMLAFVLFASALAVAIWTPLAWLTPPLMLASVLVMAAIQP